MMRTHNLAVLRWLVISLAVLAAASLAGCATPVRVAEPLHTDIPLVQSALPADTVLPAQSALPTQASRDECVKSAAKGVCGPYKDSGVSIAPGEITVSQDVWHPVSGWSQTLHSTSPGNWSVIANMPETNTSVISFPNVGEQYSPQVPLSKFSTLRSSFTEDMHPTAYTKAWSAYDIWLNNWKNEVLIQNDYEDHGGCRVLASVNFGGSGGVPLQTWDLCKWGGREIIWWLASGKEQSGSVDILAQLNWLISKGYLPGQSVLTGISYGWEICSTGGVPETFTISRFTVTAS